MRYYKGTAAQLVDDGTLDTVIYFPVFGRTVRWNCDDVRRRADGALSQREFNRLRAEGLELCEQGG